MSTTKNFRSLSSLLLGVATFLVTFHSCRDLGDNYTYDDVDGIQVRADVNGMFLTNKTLETVYYFAIEQATFRTPIDWTPPCFISISVQSGETKEIPYLQVTGYKRGCHVVLLWWHCSESWQTMVFETP